MAERKGSANDHVGRKLSLNLSLSFVPRVTARLLQGFDTPLQVFSSKLNASIGGLDATSRCKKSLRQINGAGTDHPRYHPDSYQKISTLSHITVFTVAPYCCFKRATRERTSHKAAVTRFQPPTRLSFKAGVKATLSVAVFLFYQSCIFSLCSRPKTSAIFSIIPLFT